MARPGIDKAFYWWASDQDQLPEDAGFTVTTAGPATAALTDNGVRVDVNGSLYTWSRPFLQGDPPSRRRQGDLLAVQVWLRPLTFSADWLYRSVLGVQIRDGVRHVSVVVGDTVAFVDPVDGTLLAETQEHFGFTGGMSVRMEKRGNTSWVASVDGRDVLTIPYLLAPAQPTTNSAEVRIGVLDPGAVGLFDLNRFEVGLNIRPPFQWVADRLVNLLPTAVVNGLNAQHRAMLRAMAGTAATSWLAALELQQRRSAADIGIEAFQATGATYPTQTRNPWTVTVPPRLQQVNGRLRFDNGVGSDARMIAPFATTPLPTDASHRIVAHRLTVLDSTADAYDHVGPALSIGDGTRQVFAVLVDLGDGGYGWILADSATSAASTSLADEAWRVDPYQPHEVELRLFGHDYVALLVDGQFAQRMAWADIPAAAVHAASVMAIEGVPCVFEIDGADAQSDCASTGGRPEFARACAERLLPVGGCERNDEIQCWRDHMMGALRDQVRAGVAWTPPFGGALALRGTTRGILYELRRLTCQAACFVTVEVDLGGWYLGISFPVWTPVYLALTEGGRRLYVEFTWGPPGMSLSDFLDWLEQHLIPMSTPAATFYLSELYAITGAPSAPSGGVMRYPVSTTKHLTIGDVVQFRIGTASTTHEEATVLDLAATTIDVADTAITYGAGDYIRYVHRST